MSDRPCDRLQKGIDSLVPGTADLQARLDLGERPGGVGLAALELATQLPGHAQAGLLQLIPGIP